MKLPNHSYSFTPAQSRLDLSSIPNFNERNLFAVIDLATGATIYAPTPALGFSTVSNGVLTLKASMVGLNASDPLLVLYDDGLGFQQVIAALTGLLTLGQGGQALSSTNRLPVEIDADNVTLALPAGLAQDASIQSAITALNALIADVANNHADLQTIHTDAGTTIHADLASILAKLPALASGRAPVDGSGVTQPISAAALPLPAGAATEATLSQVKAALGNPLQAGGSVTANFGTLNGAALDSSVIAVKTALGTPFQAGGAISNTAFGISGALPAFAATPTFNFGSLNGAATATLQTTINTTLGSILTVLQAPLAPAGTSTSALQTTGNGYLASLATNSPTLGQKMAVGSVPVVLSSDGPLATAYGTTADATTTDFTTANTTFFSLFRGIGAKLGTLASTVAGGALSIFTQPVDATASLSALNDVVQVAADGRNTVIVSLPTTAWTGSIAVEVSASGTFSDATAVPVLPYAGGPSVSPITAGGIYEATITGAKAIRIRVTSAIAGGPISALLRAAVGNKSIRVGTPSTNPLPVTGSSAAFQTYEQTITLTSNGQVVAFAGQPLLNGVMFVQAGINNAPQSNTNSASVGSSSSITYAIGGGGWPLAPGQSTPPRYHSDMSQAKVTGFAGDTFVGSGS